jgi:hypothetical protein
VESLSGASDGGDLGARDVRPERLEAGFGVAAAGRGGLGLGGDQDAGVAEAAEAPGGLVFRAGRASVVGHANPSL